MTGQLWVWISRGLLVAVVVALAVVRPGGGDTAFAATTFTATSTGASGDNDSDSQVARVDIAVGGVLVPPGITVDGDVADWAGILPLITDPLGDVVTRFLFLDFLSLRVTNDATSVFFLYEFAENVTMCCAFLLLDTDLSLATGCLPGLVGTEYGIAFAPAGSFIGDMRDCSFGPSDFPGALNVAFAGRFIEASVPIAVLRILTPVLTGFDIVTNNDFSPRTRYNLAPTCNGIPATIVGTDGDDKIKGTSGDDAIVGLGGNDRIDGKGGNDCIDGGDGNDRIKGDAGNDTLLGGDGDDRIDGGDGNDDLDGGDGLDRIDGGPDTDTCVNGPLIKECELP